jgi:transketolase
VSSQPDDVALDWPQMLRRDGTSARVVSMPGAEWFAEQDASYQEEVLPPRIRARVRVAAGLAARTSLARQSAGAGDYRKEQGS